MKKLVSIIMILVMLVICGTAMCENDGIVYGITWSEAEEIINEYAVAKGFDYWLNNEAVDNILYGIGGLRKETFESDTGVKWSIESFNQKSIDEFDICEIHTTVLDVMYNNITFYRSQAQSETTALGWKDGVPYYCADVIFIVYSENY